MLNTNLDKKVNIADIVNNLTSTFTNKPLSAAQGKALNDNKLDKATIKYSAKTANRSVSAATWTAVNSLTLPAGIYVIIHSGYTTGGSVRIGKGTNDGAWTASGGGSKTAQFIDILQLIKETAVSTYAYTEYTATDTVYATLIALRIV